MKQLVIFGVLAMAGLCCVAGETESVGVEIDRDAIIDQHLYPDSRNACGPAAIANSLRLGREKYQAVWNSIAGVDDTKKFRLLIDRYFLGRQSTVFPELKRLQLKGVEAEDLTAAYSELLKDSELAPIKGRYIERREAELDPVLVARIHGNLRDSLRAGVPPIMGFRSFIARRDEKADEEAAGETAWSPARNHYVVITRIPDQLKENELGFVCELIDPNGGGVKSAFVYAEPQQPFRALKGNERTGKWLRGSPFLVVQAPGIRSLQPKDAAWRDRIVIVAHFLITASTGFD